MMLTRALLATLLGLGLAGTTLAQGSRTFMEGNSKSRSLHLADDTGPMRTLLTRENKFLELNQVEAGAFFDHSEIMDSEKDQYGVYGRYGLWENTSLEASVPFVNTDFAGSNEQGIGDVVVKLDLLAFQDIFRYPFVIPHVSVSIPTGDEDKGLGTGETTIDFGVSVGTTVADQLTYIVDATYSYNGAGATFDQDDIFYLSGSIIWDITDRFAVLAEGRMWEENAFNDTPYQFQGGMAYKFTRDVQLAGYAGQYRERTFELAEDRVDIASLRLSVQF